MSNRKKITVFIILFFSASMLLLIIINYRTPFVTKEKTGWSIGVSFFNSIDDLRNIDEGKIYSKEWLKQLNDSTSFLADPFFVKKDSLFYIFFEHQKIKPGADIGLLVSKDGLNYQYKGTVLDEAFHLSYPQVFEYKNEYYMLPESQAANNVLLYKSHNFPYDWRIHDTIIPNIKLKDPTIFVSDTLNILVASDNEMRMHMYTSESLNGKWMKHKNKPIVMVGTEARAGGRFINNNGSLILPVQNSSHGYGYGLSLYEFEFNNLDYRVKKISHLHLKATKDILEFSGGMHHLDLQKINNQFYAVYDGNAIKDNPEQNLNWKGPLKWNYLDLKNSLFY